MKKKAMTMTLTTIAELILAAMLLAIILATFLIGPKALLNAASKPAGWIASKFLLGMMRSSTGKIEFNADASIDEPYENLIGILRSQSNGPCIFNYKQLPKEISNYKLHLSSTDQGISARLEDSKNQPLKPNTISGRVPCVVDGQSAGIFYNNYLKGNPCTNNCPQDYTAADIEINAVGTIIVNGQKKDLKDQNIIFKSSDGNVCFLPTYSKWFTSKCDVTAEGLNSNCISEIKKVLPECKDEAWQKVLDDYEKNKCTVDKSTCRIQNLPCKCFSAGAKSSKGKPELCSDKEPYCYDGEFGCHDKGPDYAGMLEVCKKTLGNDFQPSNKCEVDKNTCGVVNAPCTCDTAGSKADKSGKTLPNVCTQNEYCYDGQIGCSNRGPDTPLYFDYCKKSNPNFKLEEIPECNVDVKCRALNMPCKCELGSGDFDICLQNGNSYCHKKSTACDAKAC